MAIRMLWVLISLVLASGVDENEEQAAYTEPVYNGPSITQGSATRYLPFEIVVVRKVSWSSDGSLAHYWLHRENRKEAGKKGKIIIGFFVDVGTGKTLATYQVEQSGVLPKSLKAQWARSKPRAWADALLKKGAFKPGKRNPRAPERGAKLTIGSVKTPLGWLTIWRLDHFFRWMWQSFPQVVKPGTTLDAKLVLKYKPKGGPERVLYAHLPFLDYGYVFRHVKKYRQMLAWENDDPSKVPPKPKACARVLKDDLGDDCVRALRKAGYGEENRYPFRGEVTIFQSPQKDALLVFWDDRQDLRVVDGKGYGVFRSHVTVHALTPRASSTLVPKEPPRPMARPKGPRSTSMTIGKATSSPESPSMEAVGSRMPAKKKPAKKKGCGCSSGASGGLPGVLLVLGLAGALWLRRRITGRG